MVIHVDPESAASQAGLEVGMLITDISMVKANKSVDAIKSDFETIVGIMNDRTVQMNLKIVGQSCDWTRLPSSVKKYRAAYVQVLNSMASARDVAMRLNTMRIAARRMRTSPPSERSATTGTAPAVGAEAQSADYI